MTKAEEFALKEFPVKRGLVCDPELGTLETDINKHQRRFAIKVYEQAEKDLALTWEDMVTINTIGSEVIGEHLFDNWSERQVYEEVLRRFNEYKQKTK